MRVTAFLLTISFCFCLLGTSTHAQTPPGSVDPTTNELILPDGTRIAPPDGSIDASGNLVLPSGTIEKPAATVQDDGSLELGDGSVLPVPTIPVGGAHIVAWTVGAALCIAVAVLVLLRFCVGSFVYAWLAR